MIATGKELIQQLCRTAVPIVCASLFTAVLSLWLLSVFPDSGGHVRMPAISMNLCGQKFQMAGGRLGIQIIHKSHANPTGLSRKVSRFTIVGDDRRLSYGYRYGNVSTILGFSFARLFMHHNLPFTYTAVTLPYWFAFIVPFLAYLYTSRLLIMRLVWFTSLVLHHRIRAGEPRKST
jgi:hypothetical protein